MFWLIQRISDSFRLSVKFRYHSKNSGEKGMDYGVVYYFWLIRISSVCYLVTIFDTMNLKSFFIFV